MREDSDKAGNEKAAGSGVENDVISVMKGPAVA